jgi:hypothetical protein
MVDIHPAKYLLDGYLDIWLDGWFILMESHVTALTVVRLIRRDEKAKSFPPGNISSNFRSS